MIEIRSRGSGSWLDPDSARSLAAKLSTKLWERCQGHRGLFVTLTYDRSPYANAKQLYDRAAEEQHVALFMRKLERRYNKSFAGKWFCKLEFQRGGWVHWHLIILDIARMPQDEVAEMWGHGFIKIHRLNKKNVKYCTKYVSKIGDMPAWLLMARPRSVKIIRVSKSFWGEQEKRKPPPEETEGDEMCRHQCSVSHVDGYVPIAARISKSKRQSVMRDEQGLYSQLNVSASELVCALHSMGHAVIGKKNGWLVVEASRAAAERASELVVAAKAAAAAAAGGLNLIRTSNPDVEDNGYTWWINAWYRQQIESGAA